MSQQRAALRQKAHKAAPSASNARSFDGRDAAMNRRNHGTRRGIYPGRTRTGPSGSSIQPGICRQTDGREAGMNSVTAIEAILPNEAPMPGVSRSTITT